MRANILHYPTVVSGILTAIFGSVGTTTALARFPHPAIARQLPVAVDVQRGQLIFRSRCSMCHTVAANSPYNKMGPDLRGLFGRKAGSLPGYEFSTALRNSGIVWSAQTLDAYLTDPHKEVPGVKMPFPGISDKTVRADVIAYLKEAPR